MEEGQYYSLPHPPSFTPSLGLSPSQSEEPKVQINVPPPRWPTITNLTSLKGHNSLSPRLSRSHTHKQFQFSLTIHLSLSFSEGRIFRLQKLRLKYKEKQAEKKNYHPLVRAFMMQVSRESYPSEWKIYDCLPPFQNITLTLSRSKRSSPSCLFSMKSLRFLKTWNRKHMLACLSYAQNRGWEERKDRERHSQLYLTFRRSPVFLHSY